MKRSSVALASASIDPNRVAAVGDPPNSGVVAPTSWSATHAAARGPDADAGAQGTNRAHHAGGGIRASACPDPKACRPSACRQPIAII